MGKKRIAWMLVFVCLFLVIGDSQAMAGKKKGAKENHKLVTEEIEAFEKEIYDLTKETNEITGELRSYEVRLERMQKIYDNLNYGVSRAGIDGLKRIFEQKMTVLHKKIKFIKSLLPQRGRNLNLLILTVKELERVQKHFENRM